VVSRFLWHEWIRSLDGVVVSHADIDHAGGIPAVLRNFRVRTLMTGQSPEDPLEARIRELALSRGAAQIRLTAGSRFSISGVQVDVLNPVADAREASTNEGSIVLRIEYGSFSALLTGDLEKSAERQLAGSPASLKSQLLKVAHHGSRWATSELLLSRVRPRWAAISVGRGNPFGHPAPEVVNRILKSGSLPILTLDHGAITLQTDGSLYRLESHMAGLIEMGQFR
jgi:competence protein ComEC